MIQLVVTVAFASYLDGDTKKSSILDDLTVLSNLLEGTTCIIASAKTSLLNGPLGTFVRQSSHTQAGPLGPNAQLAFEKLRTLRDEGYTALSASAMSTLDTASTYESTSNAIDKLEICFGRHSENKLVICFRWFATLDAMFVKRISHLDPLALLITMHWAILLANIGKEKWWARSSGKALVAEISGILSGQRREWLRWDYLPEEYSGITSRKYGRDPILDHLGASVAPAGTLVPRTFSYYTQSTMEMGAPTECTR
ncbi:hypothetical protein LTR27_011669 [Elasticomyces elasticus]|nr:hypothetical protein LTR27_011669 [Elasticomyces elasticus]